MLELAAGACCWSELVGQEKKNAMVGLKAKTKLKLKVPKGLVYRLAGRSGRHDGNWANRNRDPENSLNSVNSRAFGPVGARVL